MKYFDVLLGQIELDDVVQQILDRCWEVRRLKHVGLMNFRSISMHPLTHSSRLEHAIGASYLAQRFAIANGFDTRKRKTFVAAALLHDISCSPFGHSVEWALMASRSIAGHEAAAAWMLEPKISAGRAGSPSFLDSPPFEPLMFGLDPVLFKKFQEGYPGHAQINSQYMDLDNIDNVFRMAHYLGFEDATRAAVLRLVDGLRMSAEDTHFSLAEGIVSDAMLWHRLRHDVYSAFIYNQEYLSFEAQIFELIDQLVEIVDDPKEIAKIADFPDDVLLWQYFIDEEFSDIKPLLRRLIANVPYKAIYVGRAENHAICKRLPSVEEVERLRASFIWQIATGLVDVGVKTLGDGVLRRWIRTLRVGESGIPGPLHVHVTTDKRKTNRRLLVSAVGPNGAARPLILGEDRLFVVAALMSEVALTQREREFVTKCFRRALAQWAGEGIEDCVIGDGAADVQLSLDMGSE